MKKSTITVNIPRKTLDIDGTRIRLEDTFTEAYIDHPDSTDQVLNLRYEGRFSEDDSPIIDEMDKLRETYGDDISGRISIYGSMLEDAHYLSFSGNIDPTIERNL
jgi:hypothetical protein